MESRKCSSSKIRDIVRLQQVLKKWRKQAAAAVANNNNHNPNKLQESSITKTSKKSSGMKFLKKTLSFSDACSSSAQRHQQHHWGSHIEGGGVPRGCLAVCVGRAEERRFVIPTSYLGHGLFAILLREAEEEFGFQNEGVLRIPCEVPVFEQVLRFIQRHETDLDPTCNHSSSSSSNYYCSHMCR
uniref:SAUR family protein n=1 Tax=Kalanchoe fedtschenkoi TaxID=63787 RepID=A0A7N0RGW2_KALFE